MKELRDLNGLTIHDVQPTPEWSMTHFDMFLKVNSPRFVGKLTSKVNSRPESGQ